MRLLLLLALAATTATAQPADTIAWQRYYPLAVGNLWEYHDAEAYGMQFRYTLVADTTVAGRTYFRRRIDQAVTSVGPSGPSTRRSTGFDFVRYDDAGGVVALRTVEADTAATRPCADDFFERDLRLGFGARRVCGPPRRGRTVADSVSVRGTYQTQWAPDVRSGRAVPVTVAAIKQYTVGILFTTFVADVGPVRSGNLWGPSLHYAVIGGVEYGESRIFVGAEAGDPRSAAFEVRALGNPSRGGATFSVRGQVTPDARGMVYDVLGRVVWSMPVAVSGEWRQVYVPRASLAPGTYVLVVSGGVSRSSVPFTVVR